VLCFVRVLRFSFVRFVRVLRRVHFVYHCCFFGTEKKKEKEGKDGEENEHQKLGACVVALRALFCRVVGHIFSVVCAERQLDEVTNELKDAKKKVGGLEAKEPDGKDKDAYARWKVLFDAAIKELEQLREEKKQLREEKKQLREEKTLKLKVDAANAEAIKALSEGLRQF
jgi:hypothetical protein